MLAQYWTEGNMRGVQLIARVIKTPHSVSIEAFHLVIG